MSYSSSRSVTLDHDYPASTTFSPEVEMQDVAEPNDKFVVAVDFGTTFSSVSYVKIPKNRPAGPVRGSEIQSIREYPEAPQLHGGPQRSEVPTESWYSNKFFWGYQVQKQLKNPANTKMHNRNRRIRWSKLLLHEDPKTEDLRKELEDTLRALRKSPRDVIADFLIQLFKHTKEQLTANEGYNEDASVELVLCVPAMWTQKASREMQIALEMAIEASKFGTLEDFFIVSEPEAAAAYVLEEGLSRRVRVRRGETFMVCDAGGGTVDVITYKVLSEFPLRLEEVLTPDGALCGSSYLNKALKSHLTERLQHEHYLDREGVTRESLIEKELVEFENNLKRTFNIANNNSTEDIWLQGLKDNEEKGFANGSLLLSCDQIAGIFLPCLDAITKLIKRQVKAAKQKKNLLVEQVVLIGGFAASPSLRSYLKDRLALIDIVCLKSPDVATAVAHGAVFRALDKEGGPRREILSSYGFLQREEYDPKEYPAHVGVNPVYQKLDGKRYINNCIHWLIKKGEVVPPKQKYSLGAYQIFRADVEMIVEEKLYVSDTSTESHYKRTHPNNKGAEVAGTLEVNLTSLKDENKIRPERGPTGLYYHVEYELVIEVDGRNMKYSLLYPPKGDCKEENQISIAAAFRPGTD